MTTTIKIQGPATFSAPATITTDKKVNLVYGLNGTGKSTVCRFLKSPDHSDFSQCEILPPRDPSCIYVYNEEFVRENFYESETVNGIFSLSKENKEAEARVELGRKKKASLAARKLEKLAARDAKQVELQRAKQLAEHSTWKIKTSYTGGDRVLEYCLEGLKAKKESLFSHLLTTAKPPAKPAHDIQKLKTEAQALSATDAAFATRITPVSFDATAVETDAIFATPIIGSQHTAVSGLIKKLGNSDWVRDGLRYIESTSPNESNAAQCPFCQDNTITEGLVQHIREFFDESYEANIAAVKKHASTYKAISENTPRPEDLKSHPFTNDKTLALLEKLQFLVQDNLRKIESKSHNPSSEVTLSDTSSLLADLNAEIDAANKHIEIHNEKLRNRTKALEEIKTQFWSLMRWDYDQAISRFLGDQRQITSALRNIESDLEEIDNLIRANDLDIADAQRETVNIDEAVANINSALLELGIDDFSIEKHDEALYRLKRSSNRGSSRFATLSEGEKMIITLLYFCELCKGRRTSTDTTDDKIVVFDDPISSLSHIYIFNVGQLIRSTFFLSDVAKQIFVFTHSLYFFYELADPKKERREASQALFRITKSKGQSQFVAMKYDEIQNDYQAYWQVVNDSGQHPAFIANCMRNIIDYFFGFVEKLEYTNVFQKPALRDNRFQAFSRYMNRESHSFGQNIYDMKEFDYNIFKDGLKLVFDESGYEDHYKKMSKI